MRNQGLYRAAQVHAVIQTGWCRTDGAVKTEWFALGIHTASFRKQSATSASIGSRSCVLSYRQDGVEEVVLSYRQGGVLC